MADQSDVAAALVQLVAARLYPNGTGTASTVGVPVAVYAGWPDPNTLQADVDAGKAHVSVWATQTAARTPVTGGWKEIAREAPTVTGTVAGDTVTIAGAAPAPGHGVALLVDGAPYAALALTGDTIEDVAQKLASAIQSERAATRTGPAITIPDARSIQLRTIAIGTAARVLERESRVYQVTVWAPSPQSRDALGRALHVLIAGTRRLALADGTAGVVRFDTSRNDDEMAREGIWRRDVMARVEHAVIETETQHTVAVIATSIGAVGEPPARTIYH